MTAIGCCDALPIASPSVKTPECPHSRWSLAGLPCRRWAALPNSAIGRSSAVCNLLMFLLLIVMDFQDFPDVFRMMPVLNDTTFLSYCQV
jgi:hypothetical protein